MPAASTYDAVGRGRKKTDMVMQFDISRPGDHDDRCIHQLFEAQVEKTPDAVAVQFEDRQLTYLELNRRANRVAARLRDISVSRGSIVALCTERSLEMMVGILGILKSGAAYVPLDPSYPTERLEFMLADSEAKVLLTQKSLDLQLDRGRIKSVYLDSEPALWAQSNHEDIAGGASPQDLAYVIYTSGSTGRPKGVMVEHKSVVNYLLWCRDVLFCDAVRVVPQVSSISFDASLRQLLAPLICGGSVWILPSKTLTQTDLLVPTLSRSAKLGFNCVPTFWATLLDSLAPDEARILAARMSVLYLGGEQPAKPLVQKTLAMFPRLQIWNLYGPTEATVNCLAGRILDPGRIFLGQPAANAQVHILDEKLEPVSDGEPGELYIGGIGVGRGYLKQPGLTAERFVPDPFSRQLGARLYRTGDRARYRADGEIEFLGRLDHQVKIRGYRIELGEIESALAEHPSVEQNVVVARDNAEGEKHLVAYVVSQVHATAELIAQLREFLREKLPHYMIPTVFQRLDSFPRNPAGKLDRAALPEPGPDACESLGDYVAPRVAVEETLAHIWREIFAIERVGIRSNFFSLGGHSLSVMRLMGRIRSAFGVEVSLREFFDNPTIESLAKGIARAPKISPDTPAQRHAGAVFPMSFFQQRLWFLQQWAPQSSAYNVHRAFRLIGPIDISKLRKSFSALARRHESLRTAFHLAAGEPVQSIESDEKLSILVTDLRRLAAAERVQAAQHLAAQEIRRPFDLGQPPLLRVSLYRLDEDDSIFSMVMHQIVTDWWSMSVIFAEIGILYDAHEDRPEALLPPLSLQCVDLALLQHDPARDEPFLQDLAYWKTQLAGPLPLLELPRDHPRPASKSYRGARVRFRVPDDVTAKLHAMSREHGATLFMVLLAAFDVLLHKLSGQKDILVGSPVAIRDRPAAAQVVGFLINEVVLRTDLAGNPTFEALLMRVRDIVLDALVHVGLPFQKLVQALNPARASSRSLLFQASFVLQNAPRSTFALGGTEGLPVVIDGDGSQLDLELEMVETRAGLVGTFTYDCDLFEAATVERWRSDFLALLEAVTSRSQARLTDLTAPDGAGTLEDSYALTPLQQSMVFDQLSNPAAGANLEQLVVCLPEALDVPAFKAAWRAVIAGNPGLRVGFCWDGGAPYQRVARQAAMPWDERDERQAQACGRAARLRQFLREDRLRGLELSQAPLMRGSLLRFDAEEFYFVWTFHHAVLDGRSFPMVLNDVFLMYEARKAGCEADLPKRPPFRDFVTWHGQRDWSGGADHWRKTMQGFHRPTSLAAAVHLHKHESAGAFHEEQDCALSRQLSGDLRELMQRCDVTLNTIMQAAWALLLHKYTGDEAVVFGAVKAGRNGTVPGAESMLGCLINVVPVRVEVERDLSILQWLRRLREKRLARRPFDQTPYAKIREWSEMAGDRPLFESLLLVETQPLESRLSKESRGPGRTFKLWEQTPFPMTVAAYGGETIRLCVEYDGSLFEADWVGRMLRHLAALLEGIAGHHDRAVKSLELFSGPELSRIRSWHSRRDPGSQNSCVHELFEAQVRRAPHAPAIVHESAVLTYRELNEQANRLARHLRSRGVGRESPVAIYLERSPFMIVSLLAVLKAGGAYVPLDPEYPDERLLYMVRTANARCLITKTAERKRTSRFIREFGESRESDGRALIRVDHEAGVLGGLDVENLAGGADRRDLAYIVFTSGSTGRPKAVEIPHGALVNHCMQTMKEYALRGEDKVLQFASLGFDVAAEEIFPTLMAGAAIVLPGAAALSSPDAFQHFLESNRISVINLPVSYWHSWFVDRSARGLTLPSAVRRVIVGSETVHTEQVRRWREFTHDRARLYNAYGTTEATITTTIHEAEGQSADPNCTTLPIGRAIANTRLYLLSRELELVPIGVSGEIFIGGVGLARGYRAAPELTAEKFVPDPYNSADPGARMYRTGDLGRYLPDGTLQFLGRRDEQLKLRGHRIEPGEIEACLASHPTVREAAVVAEHGARGEPQLAAYVVLNTPDVSLVSDLRSFLRNKLPSYMIPARIAPLDALPLQPNGKLDRHALAGMVKSGDELRAPFVAPRNAVEEEIAAIWQEVLKLEKVGVTDDFFEVGGHSLLATQISSRLLNRYGVVLTLRAIFENPTIEALALVVTAQSPGELEHASI